MLSVADALRLITAPLPVVGEEAVDLDVAAGRVLTQDIAARCSQPPSDVSAMDGYAVNGTDVRTVPARLRLIGESAAGRGFDSDVGDGEAVRIFTGAPVPGGADTIIIQENTERDGDAVTVREAAPPGKWIRRAGLDFTAGDILLKSGRILTWRDIGLAAAMNVPRLPVRKKPVIACLATGDELALPGSPLGPSTIVNSNSFAFAAAVRGFGGEPRDLGIVGDSVDVFRDRVAGAVDADLLVTFGGASVGAYDIVRQAFEGDGFEMRFYKIAMRPGKPLLFGHHASLPILGLPGNPVSVGVTTILFVRAAIAALLGLPPQPLVGTPARLISDLAANDEREEYLRARLTGNAAEGLRVDPFSKQDSSMLATFARADCLIIRPAHAPPVAAGEEVPVLRLSDIDRLAPAPAD